MDIESISRRDAQVSADILADFPVFDVISTIVRYCQTPYRDTSRLQIPPMHLPAIDRSELPEELSGFVEKVADITLQDPLMLSNIIHLADDVVLSIKPDTPILNQMDKLIRTAQQGAGDS